MNKEFQKINTETPKSTHLATYLNAALKTFTDVMAKYDTSMEIVGDKYALTEEHFNVLMNGIIKFAAIASATIIAQAAVQTCIQIPRDFDELIKEFKTEVASGVISNFEEVFYDAFDIHVTKIQKQRS